MLGPAQAGCRTPLQKGPEVDRVQFLGRHGVTSLRLWRSFSALPLSGFFYPRLRRPNRMELFG
jgi:hypothetical protein